MSSLTSFDKPMLSALLENIERGVVQLPDFQRGWVWDDAHVRSLLASISMSFPIGAVMLLETGNEAVRFKPRLVEGVKLVREREPETLILDGQQRLTSLFQALKLDRPVMTFNARGQKVNFWYYIDIAKALDENCEREEAVVALPHDRIVRNFRGETLHDYSTPEREYEAALFPLRCIFDAFEWRSGFGDFWRHAPERTRQFNDFERHVIQHFSSYQIPSIFLKKETPKEAVCQVFEKVNTGGVPLTVFELMTATFAADDFNLRDDWEKRRALIHAQRPLENVSSDEFLQAVTLLVSYEKRAAAQHLAQPHLAQSQSNGEAEPREATKLPPVSAKRRDVLRLSLDEYSKWADRLTQGFLQAAKFLRGQKLFAARDLPYQTQLVPLATLFTLLEHKGESDGARRKMARWFWCGVFGELYGSTTETRFALDVVQVMAWLADAPNNSMENEPDTIRTSNFAPERLWTLRTRNSAAYKGLHALLMRRGAADFLSGVPVDEAVYHDENLDIHHVFPQAWCIKNNIARDSYDCVVNKTPLSARTNRMVGGVAPSIYLPTLERKGAIDEARMNEILAAHHIDDDALRRDDYNTFFEMRTTALLTLIEDATGKKVLRP